MPQQKLFCFGSSAYYWVLVTWVIHEICSKHSIIFCDNHICILYLPLVFMIDVVFDCHKRLRPRMWQIKTSVCRNKIHLCIKSKTTHGVHMNHQSLIIESNVKTYFWSISSRQSYTYDMDVDPNNFVPSKHLLIQGQFVWRRIAEITKADDIPVTTINKTT